LTANDWPFYSPSVVGAKQAALIARYQTLHGVSSQPASIAVASEWPRSGYATPTLCQPFWNAIQSNVVASGALFIPVGEAWANKSIDVAYDLYGLGHTDHVHLNDIGHALFAEQVYSAILPFPPGRQKLANLDGVSTVPGNAGTPVGAGWAWYDGNGNLSTLAASANVGRMLGVMNFFGTPLVTGAQLGARKQSFIAPSAAVTWALTTSSAEMLPGFTSCRVRSDGTWTTRARFGANISVGGPTGATLWLEYSTNGGSTWTQLVSRTVTGTGHLVSAWANLGALTIADYDFRITGIATAGGNLGLGLVYMEMS
jgi:hypothetical protein